MPGHIIEIIGRNVIVYTEKKKIPEWHVCERQEQAKIDKFGNRVITKHWYNWIARTNISLEKAREIAIAGRSHAI